MKRRLATVKPRVATVAPRLRTSVPDRQATRALPTNSAEWRRIREEVLLRDLYTCQRCQRVLGGKGQAHVDHVDGDAGNNALVNLQTLCAPCHSAKTAAEDGGFGNVRRAAGESARSV